MSTDKVAISLPETPVTELPPVARSFSHFCKKCDAEKLHKVLAHTDEKSAKIECEICHKKSTFKLKPIKPKKVAKPKKFGAKSTATPKAPSWSELQEKFAGKTPKKYKIADRFDKDTVVEHPKFGVGYVLTISDDRIETVFQDGPKTLVHNHK